MFTRLAYIYVWSDCNGYWSRPGRLWNMAHMNRCAQGLLSLLLSLRRRAAIRYEAASEPCARLADKLRDLLRRYALHYTGYY